MRDWFGFRRISAAAIILSVLILAACGRGSDSTADSAPQSGQEESAEEQTQEENVPAQPQESAPSGDDLVTIVIPSVYESISTQEEADAICRHNGYEKAEILEDGSLAVTMKRPVYEELIKEFTEAVGWALQEMSGPDFLPSVVGVTHDEEYSEFTVTTRSEEVGEEEGLAAQELIMYGTLYHFYTGNDVSEITVVFVEEGTGRVLKEQHSGNF